MQINQLSDNALINEYLNGKSSAFEELYQRHKRRVYSSIIKLTKDDAIADDIFQDTFIKVINIYK